MVKSYKWLLDIPGGEVEEEERVECERDRGVVDQGDVEVRLAGVPVAVVVEAVGLKPDGDDGHHWLHDAELKHKLMKN